MTFKMNFLTILIVIFAVCSTVFGQYNTCSLVNGKRRQCVLISECRSLIAIINKEVLTQDEFGLLQQLSCSGQDKLLKVCCPDEAEIITTKTTTTTTSTSTNTPATNTPATTTPTTTTPAITTPAATSLVSSTPATRTIIPSSNLQCFTPDGLLGQCIILESCPELVNYINTQGYEKSVPYLSARQCSDIDYRRVCCALSTPSVEVCASQMSAYPPNYLSGCCGIQADNNNKIFGGTATKIDQHPWLALIEHMVLGKEAIRTTCGGVLISSKYVLTAAHCVIESSYWIPKTVRLGEYNRANEGRDCVFTEGGGPDCTDGAIRRAIEKVITHPKYIIGQTHLGYDIALIRLADAVPYTYFIRPICLPTQDVKLRSGVINMFVAGWGAINDRIASSVKMHVKLPLINDDECQAAYSQPDRNMTIRREHICAGGERGKDSCKGDSGGPLMLETPRLNDKIYEVVGIVSTGNRFCGVENVPGVYTHVYEYDNWIRSNIMP